MNVFRFLLVSIVFVAPVALAQQHASSLEVVATLDIRPGNVAVSKTGRVFATVHALGKSNVQLIEIQPDKTYKSYPNETFQKNGEAPGDDKLDAPLGIVVDKQDRLWVIDMGMHLGKTRLWCFDIRRNTVLRKITLPAAIAPRGSFIQDVAIDEKNNWAYLADIHNPGIIAVDLRTEEVRRFGNHPSVQSEDIDMVVDGHVTYFGGSPARVGINPITLSDDRETLYFGAMNGTTWYRLPAKLFRTHQDDAKIAAAIQKAGPKPISDGVRTGKDGNHYFTNLGEHAISILTPDGKLSTLIQDELLQWPDNVDLSPDGWIYISVNQLNTTPAFTGAGDEGKPPYYIYRFNLAGKK
jgi:sugar lactone lactonase YvrE